MVHHFWDGPIYHVIQRPLLLFIDEHGTSYEPHQTDQERYPYKSIRLLGAFIVRQV